MSLKDILSGADLSLKQLLYFYELTKLGVVRFDLNKPAHVKHLTDFVEGVNSFDINKYSKEPEAIRKDKENRHSIHMLIVVQLLKHVVPLNTKSSE